MKDGAAAAERRPDHVFVGGGSGSPRVSRLSRPNRGLRRAVPRVPALSGCEEECGAKEAAGDASADEKQRTRKLRKKQNTIRRYTLCQRDGGALVFGSAAFCEVRQPVLSRGSFFLTNPRIYKPNLSITFASRHFSAS